MVRSQDPTPTQPASGSGVADEVLDALMATVGRVVWFVVRATALLVWWSVLFPMLSLPVAASIYLAILGGWPAGAATGAGFVLLLAGWRLSGPWSFHRAVSGRIWKRRRRRLVYRRPWPQLCALHGLTATLDDSVLVPVLRSVQVGYVTDRLTVRMLVGQTVTGWAAQGEAFAHTFGALT